MLNHALNAKLQQICTGIGLLERNTYYSGVLQSSKHVVAMAPKRRKI
jgi:hypothetical protein